MVMIMVMMLMIVIMIMVMVVIMFLGFFVLVLMIVTAFPIMLMIVLFFGLRFKFLHIINGILYSQSLNLMFVVFAVMFMSLTIMIMSLKNVRVFWFILSIEIAQIGMLVFFLTVSLPIVLFHLFFEMIII